MYTVIKNCDVADDNGKNYAELSKNPLDGWQRKYNHLPCYRQKLWSSWQPQRQGG